MKSLYTTRRPSVLLFISVGVVLLVTALCITAMFQNRNVTVGNVSELLLTDPVAAKPTISSSISEEPVSDIKVAAPINEATVPVAVRQTAAAQSQSQSGGSKVAYSSLQISSSQRDRLFVVAISISLMGLALYGMTLLSVAPRPQVVTRRPFYKVLDS